MTEALIKVELSKHSELGASSASRWMRCPGSVALSEGLPDTTSEYALLGTAAHALAEIVYTSSRYATADLGTGVLEGRSISVESTPGEYKDFVIDEDMAVAVRVYLEEVAIRSSTQIASSVKVEQEFTLAPLFNGEIEPFGRADCVIMTHSVCIQVLDYKHGAGVPVYAQENVQQMFYALGVLIHYAEMMKMSFLQVFEVFPKTELVIVQPRCKAKPDAVDSWSLSTEDLVTWGQSVLVPAVRATREENPALHSGKWCRWCKAKDAGVCAEYGAETEEVLAVIDEPNGLATLMQKLAKDPAEMRAVEVSAALQDIFKFKPLINKLQKAMEDFSKKATGREIARNDIPGFVIKLGRNSFKWRDEQSTLEDLKMFFPKGDFEMKGIKSVAQVKATLSNLGVKADAVLQGHTMSVLGLPKLALAKSAEEVFGGMLK